LYFKKWQILGIGTGSFTSSPLPLSKKRRRKRSSRSKKFSPTPPPYPLFYSRPFPSVKPEAAIVPNLYLGWTCNAYNTLIFWDLDVMGDICHRFSVLTKQ